MVVGSFAPVLCLVGVAVLEVEDVVMLLLVDSRMVCFRQMSEMVICMRS